MSRIFLDVNVPMYAAGTAHALQEPCRRVILATASGRIEAVTDAEVFQEILHRYLYIGQREKGLQVFDRFHQIMFGHILPIEMEDVLEARRLAPVYSHLQARDLIHLAIMVRHQIETIITTDQGFDGLPGIQRLDPAHFN